MTQEELNQIQEMIDKAIDDHTHTGSRASGKRLEGKSLAGSPKAAITDVSGSADGTYSANEQTLINAQTDAINDILEVLRGLGLIRE